MRRLELWDERAVAYQPGLVSSVSSTTLPRNTTG
jgi:hypothetical protein